ncbi:hypothetical protein CRUP_014378 [Coryphaenoides rupestris]|nr:hypothetical protein CRUP_014378 [Coryphaenoides rupestris]
MPPGRIPEFLPSFCRWRGGDVIVAVCTDSTSSCCRQGLLLVCTASVVLYVDVSGVKSRIAAEMGHFHQRREVDFKDMMQAYLTEQIAFYQRVVQQLERTLHMYDNL